MNERSGFIAVSRGLFDHPAFAQEPFTEREAWMWLISEAAWRPTTVRVGRAVIRLDRGQVAFSTRFVATKWQWSEARVRRFLSRIAAPSRRTGDAPTDALATLSTTRDATQVTICNYDKYQGSRRTGDAPTDARPDAQPSAESTQNRTRNHLTRDSESSLRSDSGAEAAPAAERIPAEPIYEDAKHELFGEGVPILASLGVADRQARSMIGRWLRDTGNDCPGVLDAIQRARDERVIDPIPWITRALPTQARNERAYSGYRAANRGPRQSRTDVILDAYRDEAARPDRPRDEPLAGDLLDLERGAWRDATPGGRH